MSEGVEPGHGVVSCLPADTRGSDGGASKDLCRISAVGPVCGSLFCASAPQGSFDEPGVGRGPQQLVRAGSPLTFFPPLDFWGASLVFPPGVWALCLTVSRDGGLGRRGGTGGQVYLPGSLTLAGSFGPVSGPGPSPGEAPSCLHGATETTGSSKGFKAFGAIFFSRLQLVCLFLLDSG